MQFHLCPRVIGQFQGLKQYSYISLVHSLQSIIHTPTHFDKIKKRLFSTKKQPKFWSAEVRPLYIYIYIENRIYAYAYVCLTT
jgi:hypothetical protein